MVRTPPGVHRSSAAGSPVRASFSQLRVVPCKAGRRWGLLPITPATPPNGRELLTRRGSRGRGDVRFGLGWLIEPCASGNRICHSGSNGTGFRCHAEFDLVQGYGLIIMTNSTSGDDLWRELVSLIGVS